MLIREFRDKIRAATGGKADKVCPWLDYEKNKMAVAVAAHTGEVADTMESLPAKNLPWWP